MQARVDATFTMAAPFADPPSGLSQAEALARLRLEGVNELPAAGRRPLWRIGVDILREPMFALLVGAASIYLVIGERGEGLLLLGFATLSVSIAFVQQGRSEKALEALRELTSPRALVIRDGVRTRIAGRDVVRGDVVVVNEGDRIPADGVLLRGDHIEVDESLLTGESFPIRKRATSQIPTALSPPAPENDSQLWSGSLITRGSGMAVVLATGARTAIGRIGISLAQLDREQSGLERETRRLVLVFGAAAVALSIVVFALYWRTSGSWVDALLGAIALGMSLLPEEFPLVLTVFMVMGAWRLSKSRVLTRRAAGIEALGAATVLCADKTGTLTRNTMSVVNLEAAHEICDPRIRVEDIAASPALSGLVTMASLASDEQGVDPMDRLLLELRRRMPSSLLVSGLRCEYPLSPELPVMCRVWHRDGALPALVAAKGAPEAIASLCNLPANERVAIESRVEALARDGIRVLAVARAIAADDPLPSSARGFAFEYLGLIGFADPLRDSVPAAIRECRSAGIRVIMITGDHPATARAIARQAGIEEGEVCSGAVLRELDDVALAQRVRNVSVFARITPDQKLRIVNALKSNGEVVAMTGDGVNDAPALKAAHIGIAMGGRGTDVARESASLILLDDDFGSLVRAIRLGRRIYDNLRKAMGYILAIHIPIAMSALLPALWGWPLLLTPMLIALLELIIDPACSVILEAEQEEGDVMKRPPRRPDARLFSRALLEWSLLQGFAACIAVGVVFAFATLFPVPLEKMRSLTFLSLVGANLALIFVNRTFTSSIAAALGRPNPILAWGLGIVTTVLTTIYCWPQVRQFFGLAALGAADAIFCLGGSAALLLLLEFAKRPWRRRLAT